MILERHESTYLLERCYKAGDRLRREMEEIKASGEWGYDKGVTSTARYNNVKLKLHQYKLKGLTQLKDTVQLQKPLSHVLGKIKQYEL